MASLIPFYAPAQTYKKNFTSRGSPHIVPCGHTPKNHQPSQRSRMLFILRRHEHPEAIRNGIAPVSLLSPVVPAGFFELFRFPPIRYRPAETIHRLQRQPARSRHATGNLPLAPQRLAGCGSVDAGRTFPPARYCRKPARNQLPASQKSPYPQGKKRRPLLRRTEHPHQDSFDMAGKRLSADTSGWRNPAPAFRKAKA